MPGSSLLLPAKSSLASDLGSNLVSKSHNPPLGILALPSAFRCGGTLTRRLPIIYTKSSSHRVENCTLCKSLLYMNSTSLQSTESQVEILQKDNETFNTNCQPCRCSCPCAQRSFPSHNRLARQWFGWLNQWTRRRGRTSLSLAYLTIPLNKWWIGQVFRY